MKRTHASIVRFEGWKSGESGISTKLLVPSKLKAEPINPTALAVALLTSVPLFAPTISVAFPSPGHHATMFVTAGEQPAAKVRREDVEKASRPSENHQRPP